MTASEAVQPLEKGQLGVMLVRSLLTALFLLALLSIPTIVMRDETGLPPAAILGPIAFLMVYPVLIGPVRRYRAWGYQLGGDELRLVHGLWTHIDTVVPLRRVQHLDVAQGPLERAFGVTRLVLHTAGTANSQVVLPGLARATAEGIRDEIRSHIRQEPE